jgi:hypothetical protein
MLSLELLGTARDRCSPANVRSGAIAAKQASAAKRKTRLKGTPAIIASVVTAPAITPSIAARNRSARVGIRSTRDASAG